MGKSQKRSLEDLCFGHIIEYGYGVVCLDDMADYAREARTEDHFGYSRNCKKCKQLRKNPEVRWMKEPIGYPTWFGLFITTTGVLVASVGVALVVKLFS